jgi:lysozyme
MANLAEALGSFNPALERFGTMYLKREQELERQAEEQARGLAVALQSQGVNALEPIDKMRRDAELAAAQGDATAQQRYNLLRNIDPRTERWLPEALEEQRGIAAISTLQSHLQNLRDANGQSFVVNPFPVDGSPDLLGQAMSNYLGQAVKSPRVFAKLSDRIQAAYANSRAWMSGEHAKQQDEKASTAANVSLNNAVTSMSGDGSAGTEYFESIRSNGGSLDLFREAKKNFVSNFANTILGSVDNRAQLIDRAATAALELSSIRVGPTGPNGEPAPRLVDQLEGGEAASLLALEMALTKGYADVDNARDANEAGAGEEEQALRFESARPLLENNPEGARDWFDSERQRIAMEPDENKRRAMTNQLAADQQLYETGQLAIDQRQQSERLEDYIDNSSDTAAQKLARIRTLRRSNQISEGDGRYFESLIRPEVQEDRSEFKREQREKEDSLRKSLTVYRNTREENFGNFTEADGRWVDEQMGRVRNQAKKIWSAPNLSQEDKLQQIRDLYQKEEEKIRAQSGPPPAASSGASPSPRSGRGTSSPGGVRPSTVLPAPLPDASGQSVDTPRAVASRLDRGRRGNVQQNQRLFTQARSQPLYRRDIFMQQVKALEEGTPLDADTKLIIARTGMKPSEFFTYQYKAHNKGKAPPAEFRKWIQSLDPQLVSSASPTGAGGGSSLAQRVATRLRSTLSSVGDAFMLPAQAAGGPSDERWMQDLSRLPASRGTLPPPPPGGGTTVARNSSPPTSGSRVAVRAVPAQTRALLRTIRFAEGTAHADGYRTMFTGTKFNDLSRHPRRIMRSRDLASDAAGAYQFLSTTWDSVSGGAMSPVRQDLAAIRLIQTRGVDPNLPKGFTIQVADKLSREWASFPTAATGTSYYGQGGKSFKQLKAYYDRVLREEMARGR